MYQIEIIGMRKKRDVKIVITIIILAIIGIITCLGIIYFNKKNNIKTTVANINAIDESVHNSTNEENKTMLIGGLIEKNESNEEKFVNEINNIYNGDDGKRVFLTFDDGPTQEVTPYILDILDEYNIKATFFVLGNRVESNPGILKKEYEKGHYIANHGYSHKYSSIYKNVNAMVEEYNKTEEAIRRALDNENYTSNLFRFPGGSYGGPYEKIKKIARSKLKENGIAYLDWSALTYDAEGANSQKDILRNLKNTINGWDNVVILMHDAADKKITYETLEDVIKYLQKEGYVFKNIYDLM